MRQPQSLFRCLEAYWGVTRRSRGWGLYPPTGWTWPIGLSAGWGGEYAGEGWGQGQEEGWSMSPWP